MAQFHPDWIEHQRKRFTRPDAARYWQPYPERFFRPLHPDEIKRGAQPRYPGERIDGASSGSPGASANPEADWRSDPLLQSIVANLRRHIRGQLSEADTLKYRDDQPRVPVGNPDGGQWTGREGNSGQSADDNDGQSTDRNEGRPTDISSARKLPPIVKEYGKLTARQYISRYCRGSVNRELPSEFEDMTIADIWNIARGGDARARTCMKLLRPRFEK